MLHESPTIYSWAATLILFVPKRLIGSNVTLNKAIIAQLNRNVPQKLCILALIGKKSYVMGNAFIARNRQEVTGK